ncbi:hypothetical protein HaLaN_28888 [Haematococcus lacustris]|uniref:Uncharacterized protein n=1 Tax=Haematococcus lacustris TaxID=44745 RepID=A0A6A0ACN1_HAELA|nr:hypothetical protein HaLaN_28888 [Haematococcus lacustris]
MVTAVGSSRYMQASYLAGGQAAA